MINTIYTIGYSGFVIDDFIQILKKYEISVVIDVRSNPYSQYHLEYNKENLKKKLKQNRIYYRNYFLEFGARQSDKKYYSKEGYLDFELFSKSENFLKGIKKLENSMEKNYVIVLMCAEKDPIICHRAIMISKIFSEKGYRVIHLLPNNVTITQKDIEDRLIKKFFPNKGQLSLIEMGEDLSEKEYIKRAYNKQNAEIGYRIEEEEKLVQIYTIGFTKKTAKEFFELIKKYKIEILLDIRLNNTSQLSGFAKGKDLEYFLFELCKCNYKHLLEYAPTEELLKSYKEKNITWENYVEQYNKIMEIRGDYKNFIKNFKDYKKICFLCSEAVAKQCHRRLLAELIKKENPKIKIIHL